MTAFLQQYISPALPVILWLGRALVSGLAVWLLVRCCLSLFRGKDRESWGFVTLSNGARYEIYHWENVIGRAKRSDIRINFPSVSRSHAILSRDEAGTWRVNPLNHSSGVLLNGQRTLTTADLHPGDSIAVGGVELFFFPSDKPQPSGQPRRRPGPVGGLWLLTFIQLLLWAQFAPNFGAENIYPISAGFFGLCGLGWVLYAVSRKLHRRQFDLETLALLLTTVGFAITAAWDPGALYKQLAAVTLGMGIYGTLVWLLGRLHLAVKLRWPVAAAAAALLAFNVVMGERIFGAKNWISVGPISFQPSELVKLAFILAGAATLDRLFAKRNLIFTVLFSAYCVGCLALMSDFGTALVFFVAFLCIAFLRTGGPGLHRDDDGGCGLCRGTGAALQAVCGPAVHRLAACLGIYPDHRLSAEPHHVRCCVRRPVRHGAGGRVAEICGGGQHGPGIRRGVGGIRAAAGAGMRDGGDRPGGVCPAGRRQRPLQLLCHRRLRSGVYAGVPDLSERAGRGGHPAADRRDISLCVHGRVQHAVLLGAAGLPEGRRCAPSAGKRNLSAAQE